VTKFNLKLKLFPFILLTLILFSGCATWQSGDESETTDFIEFANVPIPSSFTLDGSRSFIYESGSGDVKVGRLFYSGMNSQDETVAYFKTGMLNRGWTPVNTMTYDAGVILNYQKEGWSSTLNITSGWFKTYVEIKIGPN